MMKCQVTLALLLVTVLLSVEAQYETRVTIDMFDDISQNVVEVVPPQGTLPQYGYDNTFSSNILGGKRTIIAVIEEGRPQSMLTTQVMDSSWASASLGSASGFVTARYDGSGSSGFINTTGLNCFDLTDNGIADSFIIGGSGTSNTKFKFFIYNGNQMGSMSGEITASLTNSRVYIPFSSFIGVTDFTCVGAIEFTATIAPNSQFFLNGIVAGRTTAAPPEPASETRTPSATPPIPFSSASRTPSPEPRLPCTFNTDCDNEMTPPCSKGVCHNHFCDYEPGCCIDSDCHAATCDLARCSYGTCYITYGVLCNTQPGYQPPDESEASSLWWISIIVIVGAGVPFLACIGLVCFVGIRRIKNRQPSPASVYDTMIDGL